MNIFYRLAVIACLLAGAWTTPVASPLFDEDAALVLTIEAPFRELIKKRLDKDVFDAIVHFTDADGQEHTLRAQLSSRGNARLEACDFPPLRLILDKSETEGTAFEGFRRLKMVTQCNTSRSGEQWLLQELGIYRAYNVITEYSYRVRQLEVTFADSESSRWRRTQPAFFIEPTGSMAARLGLQSIRPPGIESSQYNQAELSRSMLFQLLIANTDFAVKKGPAGEGCCHNGRVLAAAGSRNDWVVVPYDFDQAGIINTSYALPDRRLGIRRVNSRLYRGFCWHNDTLPEAIGLFQEHRDALEEALISPELSSSKQGRVRRFIAGFYRILEEPKELQKRILDQCRGAETFSIRKTTSDGF